MNTKASRPGMTGATCFLLLLQLGIRYLICVLMLSFLLSVERNYRMDGFSNNITYYREFEAFKYDRSQLEACSSNFQKREECLTRLSDPYHHYVTSST